MTASDLDRLRISLDFRLRDLRNGNRDVCNSDARSFVCMSAEFSLHGIFQLLDLCSLDVQAYPRTKKGQLFQWQLSSSSTGREKRENTSRSGGRSPR